MNLVDLVGAEGWRRRRRKRERREEDHSLFFFLSLPICDDQEFSCADYGDTFTWDKIKDKGNPFS